MKLTNVCICLLVMLASFSACDDDNGKIYDPYTVEQKKWISDNQEYFRNCKDSLDKKGEPFYQQLVVSNDTVLYRFLVKASKVDSLPKANSDIDVNMLGILPVSNKTIVGKDGAPVEVKGLRPENEDTVIKGLAAVLMLAGKGEQVEAVIPYSLGYGDTDYIYGEIGIPLFSTLMFTFTVKDFK